MNKNLKNFIEETEKKFEEICFSEREASIFESSNFENPSKIKEIKAEHLGDVQYKLIPMLKSFIIYSLKKAYQKGKKEKIRKYKKGK